MNPGRIQAATGSGKGDQQSKPWQLKSINHGEAAADGALKFLKVNVEIVAFKRPPPSPGATFLPQQCNGSLSALQ